MPTSYEGSVRLGEQTIATTISVPSNPGTPVAGQPSNRHTISQDRLKRIWDCSQKTTKEDWFEWFQRLCIEFIRESPDPVLRICSDLASLYFPLARELFDASFISTWSELYDQYQDDLVVSLQTALSSNSIPIDILQALLNLAEYMERNDKPLPIHNRELGRSAERCQALAKALHYLEAEYLANPNEDVIECLIGIYNQLQMREAAAGLVRSVQQHVLELDIQPLWYERLGQWDEALNAYASKIRKGFDETDALLGRMRCLHALGEWKDLAKVCDVLWRTRHELRTIVAPYATHAAWGLNSLNDMITYSTCIEPTHEDADMLRAIVKILGRDFERARELISHARSRLDLKLPALLAESYGRAYDTLVNLQILEELEEVIQYQSADYQIDRRTVIRQAWTKR